MLKTMVCALADIEAGVRSRTDSQRGSAYSRHMKLHHIALALAVTLMTSGCAGELPPSGYVTSVDRYGVIAARLSLDPTREESVLALEQLSSAEYLIALRRISSDPIVTERFQQSFDRELRRIEAARDHRIFVATGLNP